MKYIVIILTAIVLFSSCRTHREFTTTKTLIEYRDTTVYIEKEIEVPFLSTDTVIIKEIIEVPYMIPSIDVPQVEKVNMEKVIKEIGLIHLETEIIEGELITRAWLTDSTFIFNLKDSITIDDAIKEETTTTVTQVIVKEKYVSKYHKFTSRFFILFLIALVIGVGLWISKNINILGIVSKLFK